MSEVHEAGFAYDTPPTPFTMRYADSPRPSDEAELRQPRSSDIDPLYWVGVMHQQQQQQKLQLQPHLQQSEQGDGLRAHAGGAAAGAHPQMPREDSTGQDASRPGSGDPVGVPACVERHHVHLVAPAVPSRENSGFGSQSVQISSITHPPSCAVQQLHLGARQAAALPLSSRNPSVTPPPPWVQPRLSATIHKVAATEWQQPTGRRLSAAAFVGPAGCAGVPLHAMSPGPSDQRVRQMHKLEGIRRHRLEAWPVAPPTAAEIRAWQASGSAAFFGRGMPSRAAALGQRSLKQHQGHLQVPAAGMCRVSPQTGVVSQAELLGASPVPSSLGATQHMEAPCDELVRGRVAALCTPALGTRRVRSCCSPCLCDLEAALARQAEPTPE